MDNNIKIPKLEGDEKNNKQEIKAFCRQVVSELNYLKNLLDRILDKMEV